MNTQGRKLLFTTHIIVSVGWIGAVLAYLALVVAAMTGPNEQLLRAVWISLGLIGWYVIVPLALAALVTGTAISLLTPWGLFRHYWVVISWHLTVVAVAVLLQHMSSTVTPFARIAADLAIADVRNVLFAALMGTSFHAGAGLVVLLGIATLNVYKPRGLTPVVTRTLQWRRVMWIHAMALPILLAIIVHRVVGGGLRFH